MAGSALGFTCNDKIVSTGDSKAEVVMKCGEPASKDSREEEITEKIDSETTRMTIVTTDEWTYNFGPNALIRILTFRNGKLENIREAGYGYTVPGAAVSGCDEAKLSIGLTMAEVRIQCGEPTWKEDRREEITETVDKDTTRKRIIVIEEWTYNPGPNRFVRIFKFQNGKLVDMKTGGYGY